MAFKEAAIAFATEQGVDIGNTLAARLKKNLFGDGRATRSIDVIVVNKLGNDLRLVKAPQPKENSDGSGVWSSSILPPSDIKANTQEGYGCESHGFMTGVTVAKVWYKDVKTGKQYVLTTSNPYSGSNHSEASPSSVLVLQGGGDNCTVKFVIR
mmetsp:Transcript_2058/g.2284  ORF Transcript_2058/g.2284 Transcript_2058/m.2284 type:complete len:154 (-) Transcript_2058:35-496(-)